eukprot:312607_1
MSWFKAGKDMTINGRVVTKSGNSYNTAYGVQEVSVGQHEWKIKAHNCGSSNWLFIGISADTSHSDTIMHNSTTTEHYLLYSGSGNLYSKNNPSGIAYANGGGKFTNGDTITVHLDLDKQQMSFSKNGNNIGIAFSNIVKTQKYRLAIEAYYPSTKFELISYTNLSEESKEKDSIDESNYIKQCTELMKKQFNLLNQQYSANKLKNCNINNLKKVSIYLNGLDVEIKRFDIEYKKCQNKLLETQSILEKSMKVDTANYGSWSLKQVEIWLYSVRGPNGEKYDDYIPGLIKKFKSDKIGAADLPDLDQGDLRQFGVEVFKDRKNLKNILQSLRKPKEGAITAYH